MSYAEQSKTNEPVIAAIKRAIAGWESAVNQGDAAGAAATYTQDAVLMPPHATTVIGRDAIQPFFQQAFFDPFNIKISLATDEIQVFGENAFRRGTYNLTLMPKSGGDPIPDNGKYIEIWQRQSDESWKIARDIWNSDRPQS